MAIIENPLNQHELALACAKPLRSKSAIFGLAEGWMADRRDEMCIKYPGQYVLVNTTDRTHVVGTNFDAACKAYVAQYGPTPPEGRDFLGQQLR